MHMLRLAASLIGLLLAVSAGRAEPVHFVVLGDMPYDWPEDLTRFANLIDATNRLHPDFAVHVGDIKSGGTPCTEQAFQTVLDIFQNSEPPLIYTPGDNEWTDCARGTNATRPGNASTSVVGDALTDSIVRNCLCAAPNRTCAAC